jgi:xanthine dehydrogenase YagT iron-sulfur-binding subunit
MNHSIGLTLNGVARDVALSDFRVTLLDLLREQLNLTGTKKGCDRGQCGACIILVSGRRINSCLALAASYDGADITTIEGLAHGGELHPLQAAFIANDGFQCGFCTPGQIMSAVGLINEGQAGSDPAIPLQIVTPAEPKRGYVSERCFRVPRTTLLPQFVSHCRSFAFELNHRQPVVIPERVPGSS